MSKCHKEKKGKEKKEKKRKKKRKEENNFKTKKKTKINKQMMIKFHHTLQSSKNYIYKVSKFKIHKNNVKQKLNK